MRCILFVAAMALNTNAIPSQSIMVAEAGRKSNEAIRGQVVAGLDELVTLDLQRVPVKTALHAIARQAGIDVAFGDDVAKERKEVSLRVTKMTAAKAIALTLDGTGISYRRVSARKILLSKDRTVGDSLHGVITGRVVQAKTKQPMPGVMILLDDSPKGVLTGNNGTFSISTTAGEHTIHARVLGYGRKHKKIVVTDGQEVTVELMLEPNANVLEEVVVTGTVVATERKAIPNPITIVTAEEIQHRGITRIEDLFRGEVPGVVALEIGSRRYAGEIEKLGSMVTSQIYARGSSQLNGGPNPLKTYIDGVELLDPSYLGMIDPSSIDRIEIITGPQAATIYGSGAMGGVMQIFTKRAKGKAFPEVALHLRYGVLENNVSTGKTPSHQHTLNVTGGTGSEFGYSGNLSYTYSGQWRPKLFNRVSGAAIGVTHMRGGFNVNAGASVTEQRNGTAEGMYSAGFLIAERSKTGEWWDNYGFGFTDLSDRIGTSSAQTLSFDLSYRPINTWSHNILVGRNQTSFGLDPIHPSFKYPADSVYRSSSATGHRTTMSYNTTFQPRLPYSISSAFVLGLNGSEGREMRVQGCMVSLVSTSYVDCPTSPPLGVTNSLNVSSYGGFGNLRLGFFDRLFFTMGLRGEKNPNYGEAHKIDWTPTNGVTYSHDIGNLTVKLQGSYGSATRPPTKTMRLQETTRDLAWKPSEWIAQFAAPDLMPEHSRGPQGGVELYYGTLGSFTINRYDQTVTDLIQRVAIDSIATSAVDFVWTLQRMQFQYLNVAKIRQHGWESTGSFNIKAFTVGGTYSWSDSRILSTSPKAERLIKPGSMFIGVPNHTANINVQYSAGGLSMSVIANYMGSIVQDWVTDGGTSWAAEQIWSRIRPYIGTVQYFNGYKSKPGYFKSDIVVYRRMAPWASATLNIKNVGNSFGTEVTEMAPAMGRTMLLGLSLAYPR